jgi:hypothetical protein
VAYHTALRAKAINDRRKAREKQLEDLPQRSDSGIRTPDWLPLLDRELSLLPEKYREPLVLCHLQGRARKEVAQQLGLPEGTLSSRLAAGRKMLALRLTRRGLTLSGGVLASALSESTATAVPASLLSNTVKVAVLVAAGEFSAVSTSVGILMKGACQTMLWAKLKLAVGAAMVVMALGASGLAYRAVGQSAPPERRTLTEVEALRHENELLKLNLEVVLEKVRAQEAELRAFRSAAADVKKIEQGDKVKVGELLKVIPLSVEREGLIKLRTDSKPPEVELKLPENVAPLRVTAESHFELKSKPDPLHEAEAALKALREARDTEAQRKAADALEKALQKLREQQKK